MVQFVASRIGSKFLASRKRVQDWTAAAFSQLSTDSAGTVSASALAPGLSLSAKFAFAATIVLCNGMALLGGWVVTEIEKGLLQTFAAEESVYVQGLLEPIIPQFLTNEWTPDQAAAAGDKIMKSTLLGTHLASVAVWRADGSVAYSTDKDLIGRKFPLTSEIQAALHGEIKTSLWDKRLFGVYRKKPNETPIRTIYAPLRDRTSGGVIAVVEIADNAEPSKAQLDAIRHRTWIVVGISTLLMIALLFGIVHQGSRTIDQQRTELQQRFEAQTHLAQANKELSERLQESNRHGIELSEQLLRRIGMGLQDGPVQFLALALLRMNDLKATGKSASSAAPASGSVANAASAVDVIEQATKDALKEIRTIEAGLVLPELRKLSPAETLETAVRFHERATGSQVERAIANLPLSVPLPITICIFRIAEEGLSNAFRHAGGIGQKLTAHADGASITIRISDEGPGFSTEVSDTSPGNLGLRGLRQRVESIGGTFALHTELGKGTQVIARLPWPELDHALG